MLATPEIVQTTPQSAAVIHLTVPRNEMMKVFGPAVGELMTALAAQGVEPNGAVFAHHIKMSPDIFDFELGVKALARSSYGGARNGSGWIRSAASRPAPGGHPGQGIPFGTGQR
jgi:hypothetical protein